MNTKFRKFTCLVICFVFVFSLSTHGFASTITSADHEEPLDPEYVGCPEGGKHLMRGIGYVYCYNGSSSTGDPDFTGFGTQCTKCYLVLVTEYPPNVSTCTKWGKYVTRTAYEPNGSFTIILNATYSYSSSINNPYEQGFEFLKFA